MPISITVVSQFLSQVDNGSFLRNIKLAVVGLPANQNSAVAHGLTDGNGNPVIPLQVGLEPKSNSVFWEYQNADNTNIYVGVGAAAGSHAVDIYLVG